MLPSTIVLIPVWTFNKYLLRFLTRSSKFPQTCRDYQGDFFRSDLEEYLAGGRYGDGWWWTYYSTKTMWQNPANFSSCMFANVLFSWYIFCIKCSRIYRLYLLCFMPLFIYSYVFTADVWLLLWCSITSDKNDGEHNSKTLFLVF